MIVNVPKYKHVNEGFFDDVFDDDIESSVVDTVSSFAFEDYAEKTVKPQVEKYLKYWDVSNYEFEIKDDILLVHVHDNLYLPNKNLNKFKSQDWKFGTVDGNCLMTNNSLTNWDMFPDEIKGNCYANLNFIRNFKGAPVVNGKMIANMQNKKPQYPLTLENYENRYKMLNENSVYVISKNMFGDLKCINEKEGYCLVKPHVTNGVIVKCKLDDVECLTEITNLII